MKLHSRILLAAFAALATLPLAATTAQAQAFSFIGGSFAKIGNINVGETFTVGASPLTVTSLGVWDQAQDGLGEAHPVTLWNSAGVSLGSATVPSGTAGTLVGQYRYTTLGSPISLSANTTYTIGAYYSATANDFFPTAVPIGNITSAPGVTYGAAIATAGNNFSSGDILGGPHYVAANFITGSASATPEPGVTVLLAGLSVVGTGIFARRRFRRK